MNHSVWLQVHLDSVLLWGFVGALLVSLITTSAQAFGLSRMSLPFILGTAVTANRDRALALGFALHLTIGWLLAFLYALLFENLGRADVVLGAFIGLVHGLILIVVVFPLVPSVHPRMAREYEGPTSRRVLEPLGFFGRNYGHGTPLIALASQVLYGAILGSFYRSVGA